MWWRKAARRWNSGLENRKVGLGMCQKGQERPYGKSAAILKTGKGWMLLFCFCLTSVANGCGNDGTMEDGHNVGHVMEDGYNADHAMESGYSSHANANHAAQDEYSGSHTAGNGAKRSRLEEIKAAAKSYQDIYGKAAAENTLGHLETMQKIVERLGAHGYCAVDGEIQNQVNMTNPEQVEEFCLSVAEKKNGNVSFFSVMEDGGLICFDLESLEGEVYVTRNVLHWNGEVPEVGYTSHYRVSEWKYSENGYLFFRESVPEGYDGAQGYTAVRVKPLDGKCRELNRKYILPIGYGGNNMFLLDWSQENLELLDFDDLFPKLYSYVFRTRMPYEPTVDGKLYWVPEEEYEKVITSYFRVEKEMLRAGKNYMKEEQAYAYRTRGFYDCACSPNNPYPEVVSYEEREDGTILLTVDAIWPKESMEQAFCHEVVVEPLENGGFHYLSNRVLPLEGNVEPTWYVEKITDTAVISGD